MHTDTEKRYSVGAEGHHVLEAREVSKRFGSVQVLRKLSLSFSAGERVLLLGANGAGKSTLLRMLSGLSRPDAGKVISAPESSVGFVSHHLFLYSRLTVLENLALFARSASAATVTESLEAWGLAAYAKRPVGDLSKGNQVKVSIVRALLPRPSIILFDEPSSNLDEQATATLCDSLARATTVDGRQTVSIVATHDVHRLAAIGNRVIVLDSGRISSDSGVDATPERVAAIVDLYREANR